MFTYRVILYKQYKYGVIPETAPVMN